MRALVSFLVLAGAALGQDYILKSVVVDEAGACLQSSSYRAGFSAGQAVASDWLASTTFRAVLGFWNGPYTPPGVAGGSPNPSVARLSMEVSPNPARNHAVIRYALPNEGQVSLQLVDNAGRVLGSLVSAHQPAGAYRVAWDFTKVRSIGAGVYFLRLTASGESRTARIVVAR